MPSTQSVTGWTDAYSRPEWPLSLSDPKPTPPSAFFSPRKLSPARQARAERFCPRTELKGGRIQICAAPKTPRQLCAWPPSPLLGLPRLSGFLGVHLRCQWESIGTSERVSQSSPLAYPSSRAVTHTTASSPYPLLSPSGEARRNKAEPRRTPEPSSPKLR